jgi:inhibitor of KinA sporulation pathway (predicted exonuclease)
VGEQLEVEDITDLNQTQEIRGHQGNGSNKKLNSAIGNNQKVVKLVKNKNIPEEFYKPA